MPEEWKTSRGQPSPKQLTRQQCDEHIVKMAWAMGFERCQIAVEEAESKLTTPNAVKRLRHLLSQAGWKEGDIVNLGSSKYSAREIDASSQINFATLGSPEDPLDDMYGALGAATLKIGVVGHTFTKKDPDTDQLRNLFKAERIGFYIRDNYDFNGIQFLGIWTEEKVLTKSETIRLSTPSTQSLYKWTTGEFALVQNHDFQRYRENILMGGDFVLYSDVLWKASGKIIDLDVPN